MLRSISRRSLLLAFLWACLSSAEVKRERRILPLDHHRRLKNHPHLDRSLRSNTNGGASAGYSSVDGNEATRSNGGSNIKNKQNSAGGYASATKQNSATDYTSTDGKKAAKTGREKRSGTGFLGDNLNNIYGWKSHGGSAYGSPVHSYNSAPSPASSWDGGHYKSGGNSPTVNSGYTPTHSYYPSGSSKSKGSHSGKSTGKGKSKSKGKAKGKKSKGKTGKSKSSQNEAARPIESDYGRDEVFKSADDAVTVSGDDPQPQPPEVTSPGRQTVDLSPFGVLLDLPDDVGTPSSENYGMAIEVTVGYLNTYMSLQYEGQGLEEFQTTATSTIYRNGAPQIDFTASATFDGVPPPSKGTLDNNVANAFSGANLALYLSMLQNLPDGNVFRTVSGARLTNPASQSSSRSSLIGDVSAIGKAGIAGAIGAGGLILFAIAFMIYGNQRKPTRPHSEKDRKKSQRRSEQATLMGETTCSASTMSGESSESGRARISRGRKVPDRLEDVSLEPSLG